jgi:hypothetical protein
MQSNRIADICGMLDDYKEHKRQFLADRIFGKLRNMHIPEDIETRSTVDSITGALTEEFFKGKKIAITPVHLLYGGSMKKLEMKRMSDYILSGCFGTFFVDLDNKIFDSGDPCSSGKRGTYDALSVKFSKEETMTFIPIYAKRELLGIHLFDRFIGSILYQNQWVRMPNIRLSTVRFERETGTVYVHLQPEERRIRLLWMKIPCKEK